VGEDGCGPVRRVTAWQVRLGGSGTGAEGMVRQAGLARWAMARSGKARSVAVVAVSQSVRVVRET